MSQNKTIIFIGSLGSLGSLELHIPPQAYLNRIAEAIADLTPNT